MAMVDILSQINGLTAATQGSLTYYCCECCTETYGSNSGPKPKCSGCGSTGFQYPGSTREEALERRNKGYGKTNAPEAVLPTEPATEVPQAPTGAVVEKVEKLGRKIKPKAEVAPVVIPTPEQVESASVPADHRAVREATVAAFITTHQLNEFAPVEVGTAIVQAVGFTLWNNKKPVFRIQESFEDARDFAAAYNEARATQPAVRIDVAACNRVSSPELEACLFKGDLLVSLNSGHGTTQVRRGDVVKVGAYRTREGKLRFAVI